MQAEQVLVVTSKLAQGSPPELAAALHPWKFP
jgi:hypothetical protein